MRMKGLSILIFLYISFLFFATLMVGKNTFVNISNKTPINVNPAKRYAWYIASD